MFNFVCKSSLFVRHWRHTTLRASPNHQCLSLLSIRCISTTATTTKQKSLTVSYLINTCGLSPESALSVSNKFKLKCPNKADAAIIFFKSHGFSQTHISNIIKSFPRVLSFNPEKTLLPKLEFFYSKGFSSHDLANILSKYPQVLRRSLENHIIPNFNYLTNTCGLSPESALSVSNKFKLKSTNKADAAISFFKSHGFSQTHISNIIQKHPRVLLYDPEKTLSPKLEFFYSKGFSSHDLANIFFKYPQVLRRSLENHIIPNFNYLINTCGLSPESALSLLSVSNKFKLKSPNKADAAISFFKSHGFSQTHISNIIQKFPRVLSFNPEKTLLPKLEFFYSKGFSRHDLANIFFKDHQVLRRSLENHIIPNFNYLSNLLESQESTIATIKRRPYLLYHDLQTYMAPKVNILLEYGVPKYNIFMYMSPWSYSLRTDGKVFKEVVEEVKEMGINPLSTQFVKAVCIKGELSRSQWECKVNVYKRWGWSEEECLEAFRKHPLFMKHSEEKVMAAMDFFVNKMGLEFSYIVKRPIFVDYSLPKKVIPRAAVFQFMLSKGLIKSKHINLVELFNYSEKAFLEKFVNSYDEAPQLLKLYKEKLNLSKITKR